MKDFGFQISDCRYEHKNAGRRAVFFSALFFLSAISNLQSAICFACPTCGELLERGMDAFKAWNFGEGITWSMVLFFGMPVLLVGGMIFFLVRAAKKVRQMEKIHEP